MKVAAVLRDGRGSQQRGGRRFKEGVGGWRPSSVTAEDRNVSSFLDRCRRGEAAAVLRDGRGSQQVVRVDAAEMPGEWRPSSVTAEDRNRSSAWTLRKCLASGGRPP